MTRSTSNRRAFLKKAALTTTVAGGALASAQPAAAADQKVILEGNGGSGSYHVYVNDPNASAVSSTLESSDGVDNSSTSSRLSGELSDGDRDEYTFDGQVTGVGLRGDVWLEVVNPNGINRGGRLDIEGGGDSSYWVKASRDMRDEYGNLESSDSVSDDTCDGTLDFSDTDSYYLDGTIYAVNASVADGDSVIINHDL
ncbi:hypothetical protein [Halorussus sp. MSC15.2]|uniref:hypothetical protein n=1 Tax=Halorussus sp. MSC15.2 TaxID=2283638 RepID=UPI0013D8A546|nr:hypothetical protein [Halorussus sp. MSC15.2]NEU57638.1 hypothetical protein [Halorussus sp. MSC15.2]